MLFERCRDCEGPTKKLIRVLAIPLCFGLAICAPAAAQKYPGSTLDDVPVQRPYNPPPPLQQPRPLPEMPRQAAPVPSRTPAGAAGPREGDAEARALADRLPIDPATANLQSRNPADLSGTMRQLGLRVPNGPRTDMQSRSPSTRELVDALRH